MKTSFYVDGFNFYYGVFRRKPPIAVPADKWLDWRSLANHLVDSGDIVHKIHYFTATIERREDDDGQSLRQETYFRALRRVQGVELHFGLFKRRPTYGELVFPRPESLGLEAGRVVKVVRYEEKGSDVNLATRLVEDSFTGGIDHAIVVSNDTDLIAPILSAKKRIRVSVISPHSRLDPTLANAANAAWVLDPVILKDCRLPVPARGEGGEMIAPPSSWLPEFWPGSDSFGLPGDEG
ncbi:MAG: NYN domain-containing protein [Thermomicrobiales bacterium]|nr:NYN domain-containing protein [Thermomicrobiales bacterium]